MARTAVISGTATAVSGRVNRRMSERDMQRQMSARSQQQEWTDQGAAQPAPPPAPATDRVSQLTALAELKAQGLLTDEEFATEKARVLNS